MNFYTVDALDIVDEFASSCMPGSFVVSCETSSCEVSLRERCPAATRATGAERVVLMYAVMMVSNVLTTPTIACPTNAKPAKLSTTVARYSAFEGTIAMLI
jgi:hypothetical protein